MPFYEYECSSCKSLTEALQKISDPPLRKCPTCGRNTLRKLVSAPVFRLKGGGWYETDFKTDKEHRRNLASSDAGESSKEKSSDSSGGASQSAEAKPKQTDSKPAAASSSTSSAAAGAAHGSSRGAATTTRKRRVTRPSVKSPAAGRRSAGAPKARR